VISPKPSSGPPSFKACSEAQLPGSPSFGRAIQANGVRSAA